MANSWRVWSRYLWSAIVTICGFLTAESAEPVSAQDGLSQLRTEVRSTGPPAAPTDYQPSNQKPDYFDEDDDEASSVVTDFLVISAVFAASAPFWGPANLVGDDYAIPGYFPRYPYQEPLDGFLMTYPNVPRKPREWSGRVQFEHGGDLDELVAWNGGILLETTSRFGLDSRAMYFEQELTGGASDNLWLGDANLLFRFAQSPKLEMRTGIGFNWLSDQIGEEYGFNFTYGGDWFPVRPFIVSSELDWGEIGHSSLFHARVTAGVQWHRAEIYVGYDYVDVGNAQIDTCLAGFRLWF